MGASASVPVGVLSLPAEKKGGSLRVLRRDFPRPDGSAVAIFGVLWNERDGGDAAALDRILSRAIESGATLLRTEDGTPKKRFAPDHVLEYIARTTNASIVREIDIGQITRVPRVHAVVAAVYENELAVLGHGAVHAYLFRMEKRKVVPTDLLHLDEKKQEKLASRNFFGEYVSGTIRADDVVALGANTLLDYLSLEHLGALVTHDAHPEEATEKIAHLVADTSGAVPFGEVIFRHVRAAVSTREPTRPGRSLDKLIRTEEETKQYLDSSTLSFLGRLLEGKPQPRQKHATEHASEPPRERPQRMGAGLLARLPRRMPKINFEIPRAVRRAHHTALTGFIERFNHLPARAKLILPFILLGIVLFVQSVIMVQKKVSVSRAARAFETQATVIRGKTAAAEANLLYGNEEGAAALMQEVTALVADLVPPNATLSNDADAVRHEVERLLAALSHTENVTPKKIANVSGMNIALAGAGKDIAALDRAAGSVSVFRPGKVEQSPDVMGTTDPSENGLYGLAPKTGDAVLAIGAKLRTISIKEKKISPLEVNPTIAVADAAIWNKRLYQIGSDGKIYRHDKSDAGFAVGVPWLKDDAVPSPRDMEIDSSIYVLGSDGAVTKYLGGKKQAFALPTLDPPLKGPTRIRTWADSEVLAILDPGTGRIVFVSSSGKLLKQYKDPTILAIATDFAIDPAANTIYVAAPGAVYSFAFSLK